MNIFHPDKSSDYIDPKFSQTILHAYKNLQHNSENITKTAVPVKMSSASLKSKHHYSSENTRLSTKKQKSTLKKIGFLKSGSIAIVVMAFGLILLMPSSPQLISKKHTENPTIKNYGDKSSGWKSPRARNTQREAIEPIVFTQ